MILCKRFWQWSIRLSLNILRVSFCCFVIFTIFRFSEMLVVNANSMETADDVYDAISENLLAWEPNGFSESDIRVLAEKFLVLLHNG